MSDPSFADLVALQQTFYANFNDWIAVGAVPIRIGEALLDGERLDGVLLDRPVAFSANFAGYLAACAGGAPASTLTLTIYCFHGSGTATIGTVSIASDKTVTATTAGGISVSVAAGSYIYAVGPNPAIAGLTDFAIDLRGVVDLTT